MNLVELQFTGKATGPVRFRVNGTEYQGADSTGHRFIQVPNADVPALLMTGFWALTGMGVCTPEPEMPPEDIPPVIAAIDTPPEVEKTVINKGGKSTGNKKTGAK